MTELTNELRDELYAVPAYTWQTVPVTANRHKWRLRWYRGDDDDGEFFFAFDSPKGRRYSCFAAHGKVTDACIASASGYSLASYRDVWGEPQRMDAVMRLVPKHVLRKLSMLLDAIR